MSLAQRNLEEIIRKFKTFDKYYQNEDKKITVALNITNSV